MAQIRLDKFLANAGCGTRTEVKQLLKKGLVTVNGEVLLRPEIKIDDTADRVSCQGKDVSPACFYYYMLNKPAGYLSATRDDRQPVVLDLMKEPGKEGLFPVGRLDIDTEGLLLLTNDGALAHGLLAPGRHVEKTYLALLDGPLTEEDCRKFEEGLDIGEKRMTMPARLVYPAEADAAALRWEKDSGKAGTRLMEEQRKGSFSRIRRYAEKASRGNGSQAVDGLPKGSDSQAVDGLSKESGSFAGEFWARVTVCEGKYHQVKRMFEAVGRSVRYLKRVSMGSLRLDPALASGEYRRLTREEIEGLRNDVKREKSGHI